MSQALTTLDAGMERFYSIAHHLGHNRSDLEQGRQVRSQHVCRDYIALRNLMRLGQDPDVARTFTPNFLASGELKSGDARDPMGLVTRLGAYVFADGPPPSEADQTRLSSLFPMMVEATSGPLTLQPGQMMQLGQTSGPGQYWNISILTMGYGSSLFVKNTALSFTVANVVKQAPPTGGGGGAANYDLGILGATGAAGGVGTNGGTGGGGAFGTNGSCKCSGSEPGSDGTSGSVGAAGITGGTGYPGSNGLPSLPATITISAGISGPNPIFTVGSISGAGGSGGLGGNGGRGGAGGNGGYGSKCAGTCDDGGNGADGGRGGRGGTGGSGGDGVAGQPISVTVPQAIVKMIFRATNYASGGDGGVGGVGGPAGAAGSAGGAAMYCHGGSDGAAGTRGATGPAGIASNTQGIAGTITITGV